MAQSPDLLDVPPQAAPDPAGPSGARHPAGLYILSTALLCERFSFYLLVALFVLYLNEHRGFTEASATRLFGHFMGLCYLTPFVGGLLADRGLGYLRAALLGTVLLAGGYFALTVDHPLALLFGLVLVALGSGLFKPSILTMVGNLYLPDDRRRDAAFNIAYLGTNIGATLSPLIGDALRRRVSWSAAFLVAGVGMLAGLLVLGGGVGSLAQTTRRRAAAQAHAVSRQQEHQRVIALAIMAGILMLFWMAYCQNGGTLVFWTRDCTERHLHGFEVPIPFFTTSLPSVLVVMLTPVLVRALAALHRRGLEPSTPGKIFWGMAATALAFAVLTVAAAVRGGAGRVSMGWLLGCFVVLTVAELLVSPMGMSLVARLAPPRMAAMLMGLWFGSVAVGNALSGQVGALWSSLSHVQFFGLLVLTSLLGAAAVATQLRRLKSALPREADS